MPTVKKNINSQNKRSSIKTPVKIEEPSCSIEKPKPKITIGKKVILFIIFILILLGAAAYFFKGMFLAAVVDGRPVFRQQLNQKLSSTYGKEVLENIIVEDLIRTEAKRRGIDVAKEEIDKEIEKIKGTLGQGVKLEDVLSYQGVSLADFEDQIKLRLQVNKILEKDITISDEEITTYLKDNVETLTATGEAEKKEEANQILREQKINEKIQTWISDLLAKAKINRFLK